VGELVTGFFPFELEIRYARRAWADFYLFKKFLYQRPVPFGLYLDIPVEHVSDIPLQSKLLRPRCNEPPKPDSLHHSLNNDMYAALHSPARLFEQTDKKYKEGQ
jgi:hypothetical protein